MALERVSIPLGLVVLVAGSLLLLAWLFQRSLIYFPLAGELPPVEAVLPSSEAVTFVTDDGLSLHGWFVPPLPRPRGGQAAYAVLVFNGNAGNREMRVPLAEALADAGMAVLLFDYRGYGGNPGRPSERGLVADARAAVEYLARRQDVDPTRIVYFGESLGAAVAVALADERPPAALILRSPFTSLVDMAGVHYPFLPAGLLLKDRFSSIEKVGRLTSPLLVIVGENDSVVPVEQSRRLYETATATARFVQIDGADHNDYVLLAGEGFIDAILKFLKATLEFS